MTRHARLPLRSSFDASPTAAMEQPPPPKADQPPPDVSCEMLPESQSSDSSDVLFLYKDIDPTAISDSCNVFDGNSGSSGSTQATFSGQGGYSSDAAMPRSPDDQANFLQVIPALPQSSGAVADAHQKLADLNMIIVGRGAVAEELLRRRVAHGGRAVLVLTEPTHATIVPSRHAWTDFEGDSIKIPDAFVWQPPAEDEPTNDEDVRRLRFKYGCHRRSGCKFGPDVVGVAVDSILELLRGGSGELCGARVRAPSGELAWQLSGAVVLAKEPAKGMDMAVRDPEAMPWTSSSFASVGMAMLVQFAYIFGTNLAVMSYEPGVQRGGFKWWNFIWAINPFGLYFGALGETLTGVPPDRKMLATLATVCPLVTMVCGTVSVDGWRLGMFMTGAVNKIYMVLIGFPLYWLWARPRRASKPFALRLHLAWFAWVGLGSMSMWVIFFGLVSACMALRAAHPNMMGLLLSPILCAALRIVMYLSAYFYGRLVEKPKANGRRRVLQGDQRAHASSVMELAFAFKEGAFLVALVAAQAIREDRSWIVALLASTGINLVQRLAVLPHLAKFLPQRIARPFRPLVGVYLHHQARYTMGYPRFVAMFAIATSRVAFLGDASTALFNPTCALVVLVALALTVLEDIVVLRCFSTTWGVNFDWSDLSSRSWKHVFAVDDHGMHIQSPSPGFHGVRYHTWYYTLGHGVPASMFPCALLALLLGEGYVLGRCPHPIAQGWRQVLDGIVWTTPMYCGSE